MSKSGYLEHRIVISPLDSRFWAVPQGARLVEPGGHSPAVTFPAGFLASGIAVGLKTSGRPDVGVVAVAPEWRAQSVSAAVFTTNAFAAAPVIVDRTECDLGHIVAVAMNSGNANACTGSSGLEVARAMQVACADTLDVSSRLVAIGSTGIIGVQLDAAFMAEAVRKASAALHPGGGPEFGHSILTTDRFAKMCAFEVHTADGPVRLGSCAKGAGMISPAMATMLCVVSTDALLTSQQMYSLLTAAVAGSFNRVTVDGEMSTNDTVFFLSSGASGVKPGTEGVAQIAQALEAMLLRTALMMVADGEGASKIMRLQVLGASTEQEAELVARSIADSPLVKTAMHGGDANWGRILSSAGAALAGRVLPNASLELCDVTVVQDAAACVVTEEDAARMTARMKGPEIDIRLDLGIGNCGTQVFFADMGHEYIRINADYHT